MKHFLLAIVALFFGINSIIAQDLDKKWELETVQNETENNFLSGSDILELTSGEFNITSKASGDYIHQNNLLVLLTF
mgnify:FL=1